jgi:hypothetical protein
MYRNAFVKVNRSEMAHNKGDLFYIVCCVDDQDGRLSGVLDMTAYPFAWGFQDIKHALAIADACNDPYSEVSISAMARRYANEERP